MSPSGFYTKLSNVSGISILVIEFQLILLSGNPKTIGKDRLCKKKQYLIFFADS